MRKELSYFQVDGFFGGWQEWFASRWMRLGGCAAVTATDVSIYFDLYKGTKLTGNALDLQNLTRAAYCAYSEKNLRPYLEPRWSGIDRLEIYLDGYRQFLHDRGESSLILAPWNGTESYVHTEAIVKQQIDKGFPIPTLTLHHHAPIMQPYVWHWYILGGYEETSDGLQIKLITYGAWRWLKLRTLWETGYTQKGGLILFDQQF